MWRGQMLPHAKEIMNLSGKSDSRYLWDTAYCHRTEVQKWLGLFREANLASTECSPLLPREALIPYSTPALYQVLSRWLSTFTDINNLCTQYISKIKTMYLFLLCGHTPQSKCFMSLESKPLYPRVRASLSSLVAGGSGGDPLFCPQHS